MYVAVVISVNKLEGLALEVDVRGKAGCCQTYLFLKSGEQFNTVAREGLRATGLFKVCIDSALNVLC